MGKPIDLTGKKFGKLTAICIDKEKSKKGRIYWKCRCDCGNESSVQTSSLNCGNVKSCGCLRGNSTVKERSFHNQSKTRLYKEWQTIKCRCRKEFENSKVYYERGIEVCKEWQESFIAFRDWALANGYDDTLTIDRIDNDKGYSPDNCRWVTMEVQNNNKRGNIILTYNGETHTAAEWGRIVGLKRRTVAQRVRYGWSVEDVLFTPVGEKRKSKQK